MICRRLEVGARKVSCPCLEHSFEDGEETATPEDVEDMAPKAGSCLTQALPGPISKKGD
jgi:hypothetical protein